MGNNSLTPSPKVVAGGLGGAIVCVILWAVSTYGHINFPPDVSAALTTILMTFISYLTPHNQGAESCSPSAPSVTPNKSQD